MIGAPGAPTSRRESGRALYNETTGSRLSARHPHAGPWNEESRSRRGPIFPQFEQFVEKNGESEIFLRVDCHREALPTFAATGESPRQFTLQADRNLRRIAGISPRHFWRSWRGEIPCFSGGFHETTAPWSRLSRRHSWVSYGTVLETLGRPDRELRGYRFPGPFLAKDTNR